MRSAFIWVFAFLVLALPGIGGAGADTSLPEDVDLSGLSDAELLDLLASVENRINRQRPVAIAGVPSGFGVARGRAYVGLSLTDRRDRRFDDWDGSLSFGVGFGDAHRGIGIVTSADITSLTPYHFGSSGTLGLSLHREFALPGPDWHLSLGLVGENLVRWGDSLVLSPEWTIAASAVGYSTGAGPVMLTLGYGSAVSANSSRPGVFAGIGVGMTETTAASLAWHGDEAIAAINLWPRTKRNVSISLGVGDLANSVNARRLLLSVSLGGQLFRR